MGQKLGTFINKNGGTFTMPIVEKEDVSVLEGGYLITKDGQFIPVKDGQDHDKVFNEYLNKYECRETPIHYDTAKAFTILVNVGKVFKREIVPLTFIHLDSTMYELKKKEGKSLH